MIMNQKGRGNDNFQTPKYIFDQLNRIFNFDIDIACTSDNCLCERGFYHDQNMDALTESWKVEGGGEPFATRLLASKQSLYKRHITKYQKETALFA